MRNILSYGCEKVWTGQEIIDWIVANWNSSHAKAARQLDCMTIVPNRRYMIGKEFSQNRWKFVVWRAN